jgi:lipoprotein-releasing system permease protein
MNGFEGELRSRLLSMSAHGFVTGPDNRVVDWPVLTDEIAAEPGVVAAAPFVSMEGMIRSGRALEPVIVHGIDPAAEQGLSGDQLNLIEGRLDQLQGGTRGIVLGRILAYSIGARLGDGIVLLVPRPVGDGTMEPKLERFIVSGIFEAGLRSASRATARARRFALTLPKTRRLA